MKFLKYIPLLGRKWWRLYQLRQLGACGQRISLPADGDYHLSRMFLGNDINIGKHSTFWAVHSRIVIGDNVIFGPEVMVMGGNHNTSLAGRYMVDFTEKDKRPDDDQDVIFEGDNWIGARAIILKGVTIGRGAVIAAGSVVVRSVPPYSITVGIPARPRKLRGSVEEIILHELKLYKPDDRISKQKLEDTAMKLNLGF